MRPFIKQLKNTLFLNFLGIYHSKEGRQSWVEKAGNFLLGKFGYFEGNSGNWREINLFLILKYKRNSAL